MKQISMAKLKKSPIAKHRKIHEKATRIIKEGHRTKQMTEHQILELGKLYPTLNVRVLINSDVVVGSEYGSWLICDERTFHTMYHNSFKLVKGKLREEYHLQDVYYDLAYVFASIVSHDGWRTRKKGKCLRELKYVSSENMSKII